MVVADDRGRSRDKRGTMRERERERERVATFGDY